MNLILPIGGLEIPYMVILMVDWRCYPLEIKRQNDTVELTVTVYSLQIFNAARQLSHTEAAPDKSGLVLLDYWFGLKRCLVIIHN